MSELRAEKWRKRVDEETKAKLMLKRIKEHFKFHHYFTKDDLEQFEREEYQAETRRGILESEGLADIAIIDGKDIIDEGK